MKNLASQFLIAGYNPDETLSKKQLKIFEKFYKTMEGKYFVGINDKNETVRFKVGYISYTAKSGCINIAKTPDIIESSVTIHRSKINWFEKGAWIDGCGSII